MAKKFDIEHLDWHYGDFHALKDVSLHIPEREVTAFIGPSGGGKSTLMKTLDRMNDLVENCRIAGTGLDWPSSNTPRRFTARPSRAAASP